MQTGSPVEPSNGLSARLPVVALVGRPNVGKSTLFNLLTRTRDAIVADMPGLTRDRIYGYAQSGGRSYLVVDTGGLTEKTDGMGAVITRQTELAIAEADAVLFMLDARSGLTADDRSVVKRLRRSGKPIHAVVNKSEGLDIQAASADFYSLGLGELQPISATHGDHVDRLIQKILSTLPETLPGEVGAEDQSGIRIAVVGRPNVGKSTLVNRLIGEERVLAYDEPGTTRDSIFVPFDRDGQRYVLIDTAGIRRRARVEDMVEKISVIKALQAIEQAQVVIALLDARQDIGAHDAHLLGLVAERGRAMVIGVNKWDGLESSVRRQVQSEIDRRMPFLDYAPLHFISALHGGGLGELFEAVNDAYRSSVAELPTPELTRVLEQSVEAHSPPAIVGRRIKLRYAHQGGRNPPTIVIHGNQTEHLPVSYHRYLIHRFREAFKLVGTPLRLQFKTGTNPFKGKRNELNTRQVKKRRRMIKHSKR